jgi:release factor glutamine methyltransferase
MDFDFEGVSLSIPDDVYQPSEDSFMLAKAAREAKGKVLEVGCGSGIASLACAKTNPKSQVLGIDISPAAVKCANGNAKKNKITNARFEVADFFKDFLKNVPDKQFDSILFNPPYLPTEYNEKVEGPLNFAFDGGKDGRKILDPFLARFDRFLKPGGSLFLVQSTLNNPKKTEKKLNVLGYSSETVEKEDFFFESVFIIKATKPGE